jgi:hypothetical protein
MSLIEMCVIYGYLNLSVSVVGGLLVGTSVGCCSLLDEWDMKQQVCWKYLQLLYISGTMAPFKPCLTQLCFSVLVMYFADFVHDCSWGWGHQPHFPNVNLEG